jgi:predicted RNA polymerase sigma factor
VIRICLLKGIAFGCQTVAPTDAELDALEAKVLAANPADTKAFAWVSGRNWAVSRVRHARAEQARLLEEAKAAEAERRKAAVVAEAEAEIAALIARVSPTVIPSQRDQLRMVWLKVVKGYTDLECADAFPETTNLDARNKRLQRGKKLLLPHATPALRDYLAQRTTCPGSAAKAP